MINMNLRSIIEVRGFIKVIQLLLAMIVFSTAVNSVFKHDFTRKCINDDSKTFTLSINVKYPYESSENNGGCTNILPCDVTSTEDKKSESKKSSSLKASDDSKVCLLFNYKSSSQFYVLIAVISFIYTTACVIYMVFFEVDSGDLNYTRHQIIYYVSDIILSCVFVLIGIIASISFMVTVSSMKGYDKNDYLKTKYSNLCNNTNIATCEETSNYGHATLIMSILFSLVHSCVFAASLGMMWRDRVWRPNIELPTTNMPNQGGYSTSLPSHTNTGVYYGHDDPVNLE